MKINDYELDKLVTYEISEPDNNGQQILAIKLRKSGNNDDWLNIFSCSLPVDLDTAKAGILSEIVTQEIIKIIEQVSGVSIPRGYIWDSRKALAYLTNLINQFASDPSVDLDTYAHFINVCQTTYRGRIWSINDEDSFKEFLSIFGWTEDKINEELVNFTRTLEHT